MNNVISYIKNIFSLDTRSLAILRIWLGLILIRDILIWLQFLSAFHTDVWIMPLQALMDSYPAENVWSIHSISNEYNFQLILFLLHLVIAVLFTVWRKTKIFTILLWIFTVSVHGHNPIILNGWDTITRLLLFWSMFLPLWDQFSLDNIEKKNLPVSIFSIATLGYVIQLSFVYIFASILKDHPRRISDFTSTYYALSLDLFRTPIWDLTYMYPEIMRWMTAFSYYVETIWIGLLLVPWKNHLWRIAAILLFVIFHIWLGLHLRLYSFPYIMVFARIALLPHRFWERWFGKLKKWYVQPLHTIKLQKFPILISLFLILCLAYIFSRNLRTTDFDKHNERFPREVNKFWFLFRIDQYWNMFAPYPLVDDGWTVIQWNTVEGKSVDLLHPDLELSFERPVTSSDRKNYYDHERRRKYYTNLWMKSNSDRRQYWAAYHCHLWNTKSPDNKITDIKRYYMLEKTLDDYKNAPLEKVLIYESECTG